MGKVQKRELRDSLKLQRAQLCHLGDDHPMVTDRRGQGENNIAGREMQDGEGKGGRRGRVHLLLDCCFQRLYQVWQTLASQQHRLRKGSWWSNILFVIAMAGISQTGERLYMQFSHLLCPVSQCSLSSLVPQCLGTTHLHTVWCWSLVSYKYYQPLILPFVFFIFCNFLTVFNGFSAFWSHTPSQCFSFEYQSSTCFPPYIVQSQEAACLALPVLMLPILMQKHFCSYRRAENKINPLVKTKD